jgi:sterol desaturase/sphingolipid hydroxylase (fatty acid hydroxylase superfamily)
VTSVLIIVPVAIVLGLTAWVLIIYELTDLMVSVFSHANLRVPIRPVVALGPGDAEHAQPPSFVLSA